MPDGVAKTLVGHLIGHFAPFFKQDYDNNNSVQRDQIKQKLTELREGSYAGNPLTDPHLRLYVATLNKVGTEAQAAGAVTLNYGQFINTIISFIIVAFAIFLVIKNMNKLKREEPAPAPAEPTTKKCQFCFSEIPIEATRCPQCTSNINQ